MELEKEPNLFAVFLNDEQLAKRLTYTKPYTGAEFQNCSNLVLVLLGLVDPRYYLEVCTRRRTMTPIDEIISYIQSSFSQCGIDTLVSERLINVDEVMNILKTLRQNYATPLGVYWKDGAGHSVLVRKNKQGVLEYIDPQISDDRYPFKITGEAAIQTFLNENAQKISVLVSYRNIDEADSLSEKCMTTRSPMDVEDEKKPRKPRKNGKKTKKSRKHHGVRTRRRRH